MRFLVWDAILPLIFFQNSGMGWANTVVSGIPICLPHASKLKPTTSCCPHVCSCVPQQSQPAAVSAPQCSCGERMISFQRCQLSSAVHFHFILPRQRHGTRDSHGIIYLFCSEINSLYRPYPWNPFQTSLSLKVIFFLEHCSSSMSLKFGWRVLLKLLQVTLTPCLEMLGLMCQVFCFQMLCTLC